MDERQQSLIDRMTERLAPRAARAPAPPVEVATAPARPIDWRFAVALAGLIALAPLLTIVGAKVLEARERAAVVDLQRVAGPRVKAAAAERDSRLLLREAARGPTLAVSLDRMAAALPAEARLSRIARLDDGRIEVEVLAPDPDTLRAALRRARDLAFLREAGQRRSDAMTLVTLRGQP